LNTRSSKALLRHCDEVSELFGALSHPTRLKILCCLLQGETTVTVLTKACSLPQPSVSQFLARMREDNLIESRREGQNIFYKVCDPRLFKLLGAVKEIYCK
jgi:DNA-binding transcriptional ArsR family regulator